jgi:hypothetical protein
VTNFAITHDFRGDAPGYWQVFFDEEFKTEQYRRIGVRDRKVLAREEDSDTIRMQEHLIPGRDLPGFLKKLLGGDLGYTEHTTFWKKKNRIDFHAVPTLLRERTKIRGVFSIVTVAPGKLRRTFEGDIDVNVPLVSGKVERTVIDDIQRSYDIAAQVTQEWLNRRADAL